ncbi:hypothetical protein INS49_003955 [Diaporthe citri]|uniref:uncharacterized protein n=1 Tax=Diaporthe citri TaxID=83186 RepID=UPI001C7F1565|nr:uncharacterized protein INS49_003955 [Diaporthe citri]KAG6354874.1 hypothetical protein INS49_003955 [Diaporthe citri]
MSTTTPPSTTIDDEHFAKRRRLSPGQDAWQYEGQEEQEETSPEQTTPRQHRHQQPDTESQILALHQRPPAADPLQHGIQVSRPIAIQRLVDLQFLEVPIFVKATPNSRDVKEQLPADILSLYTSIRSAAFHHKAFIPAEVRHKVEEYYGDDMQAHWFRTSRDDTGAQQKAEVEFEKLRSLQSDALKSKSLSRYEDAWNAKVHLPLLELALTPDEPSRDHTDITQAPKVEAELVSSAMITADSVPRISVLGERGSGSQNDGNSILACSASQSGTSSSNSGMAETRGGLRNKGSKKVDLVLVLVPTPSSRLQHAITYARQFGSVNQSTYGPLRENPIACAIETKITPSNTDPIVQLGVWTAAWYRRMDALWRTTLGQDTRDRGRMVSLPLITIVDHAWSLYFAVDRGDHIVFFGPEFIGSTDKLDAIYSIHACLKLIQGWIQSEFHAFLEQWFGCDQSGGCAQAEG